MIKKTSYLTGDHWCSLLARVNWFREFVILANTFLPINFETFHSASSFSAWKANNRFKQWKYEIYRITWWPPRNRNPRRLTSFRPFSALRDWLTLSVSQIAYNFCFSETSSNLHFQIFQNRCLKLQLFSGNSRKSLQNVRVGYDFLVYLK